MLLLQEHTGALSLVCVQHRSDPSGSSMAVHVLPAQIQS